MYAYKVVSREGENNDLYSTERVDVLRVYYGSYVTDKPVNPPLIRAIGETLKYGYGLLVFRTLNQAEEYIFRLRMIYPRDKFEVWRVEVDKFMPLKLFKDIYTMNSLEDFETCRVLTGVWPNGTEMVESLRMVERML